LTVSLRRFSPCQKCSLCALLCFCGWTPFLKSDLFSSSNSLTSRFFSSSHSKRPALTPVSDFSSAQVLLKYTASLPAAAAPFRSFRDDFRDVFLIVVSDPLLPECRSIIRFLSVVPPASSSSTPQPSLRTHLSLPLVHDGTDLRKLSQKPLSPFLLCVFSIVLTFRPVP